MCIFNQYLLAVWFPSQSNVTLNLKTHNMYFFYNDHKKKKIKKKFTSLLWIHSKVKKLFQCKKIVATQKKLSSHKLFCRVKKMSTKITLEMKKKREAKNDKKIMKRTKVFIANTASGNDECYIYAAWKCTVTYQ